MKIPEWLSHLRSLGSDAKRWYTVTAGSGSTGPERRSSVRPRVRSLPHLRRPLQARRDLHGGHPMTTATAKMLVTEVNGEGRGTATVTVPAGTYWVGDPCYPFPNDGPNAPKWDELLRDSAFFDVGMGADERKSWNVPDDVVGGPVGPVTVDGHTYEVLAFGTQHGDGGYPGSDGFEYGVDAGLIGLVPMGLVTRLGEDPEFVARVGTVMVADAPFVAERNADGLLTFGTLTIDTGDPKCEECGGATDGNGNCSTCACWNCGSTSCSGAGPQGGRCDDEEDDDEDEEDDDDE